MNVMSKARAPIAAPCTGRSTQLASATCPGSSQSVCNYDAIVVGIGAMGSSALYHAAQQGLKVLGLEQFSIAHDRGSSHGETRIIRLAYNESPLYVPILRRSYQLWEELASETGQTLLTVTGGLDLGGTAAAALASVQEHGLDHELLTGAQVNARFPGYQLPGGMPALFQPDAGILHPEACIQAHCKRAQDLGAELHEGEKVVGWKTLPGGSVQVSTDKGQYTCGTLVLTAGPWMASLVPELKGVCKVERQVVGWFEVADAGTFRPDSFPVFVLIEEEEGGGCYYGFPQANGTGFKIGKYNHLGGQCDPDSVDRALHESDVTALRSAVQKYFPGADGPLLKHSACMFTNTPDGHFIIDRHPTQPQVLLCSACSGHGFKMSSAIGEALAQMAAGQEPALELSLQLHKIDPVSRIGHQQFVDACCP